MKKLFLILTIGLILAACTFEPNAPEAETPTPPNTQSPTESPEPAQPIEENTVTFFLYKNPQDEVNPTEQLIAITVPTELPVDTPEQRIEAALTALFSVKEGLYDEANDIRSALYSSNLTVEKVEEVEGTMEVHLKGDFIGTGVVADAFMKPQIESTIDQYADPYRIYLNGTEKNWECALDYKGDCQ